MASQVLFVDDEENILNAVERLFFGSDIAVLKATSAQQALEILQREKVSVVVSDYRMPGMKGVDLLDQVRECYPEITKILMTAYADLPLTLDAINRGEVFRFICKPWSDPELVQAVEDAIGRNALCCALRNADDNTLLALAQAIELKDPYTRGHCERVAGYALGLAELLGLDGTQKNDLKLGSWLHDCGKIGVPEQILTFHGSLKPQEFDVVKNHPHWGAAIAREAHLPKPVGDIILFHHERYDGQGYPHRLKGTEIPLLARIVTIADIFDALCSDRPYQQSISAGEALQTMAAMVGSVLDPGLAERFFALIGKGDIAGEPGHQGTVDGGGSP
jgi:putative nucleotidyltransferase with HDIG domain